MGVAFRATKVVGLTMCAAQRRLGMLQKGIRGFFLGLVLFAVVPAWGQDTGTLTGTVTDSSSAVVANAQVTVTDTAINFETSTVTNSEGIYRITFLRPGTYRVKITASGF